MPGPKNFVKACSETTDEHSLYINTPQTAADLNNILDALGQEDMVYWGLSYGTTIGQTYATLFPERPKRIIIDAVNNQFNWYEELVSAESGVDTVHVLEGFFDECLKAGEECSLSTLADSRDALMSKVLGFVDNLAEEPVSVYVNNSHWGLLDYPKMMYGAIFPAL